MISLLFDVRPPTSADGAVGLVLLAIVIAALVFALLLGFVLFLKFLRKRRAKPMTHEPQAHGAYNQP